MYMIMSPAKPDDPVKGFLELPDTTEDAITLSAIIEALQRFTRPTTIRIYTKCNGVFHALDTGRIQSAKMNIQGQSTPVKFLWENGRLQGQVINVMGNDLKIINKYDVKGVITGTSIDLGGNVMDSPYSDIKLDDHGNWISRKASMMGQEMENTRTIVYY